MPIVVPREKHQEMDWRAADKVATWKVFKCHMNVIFVADQVPKETVHPHTCGRRRWSIQPLEHSWRHGNRPQGSRPVMGSIQEELWTINFILTFQRYVLSRFQTRSIEVNSWPRSTHQGDSPGVPMEEGVWGGVNDWLAVPCHNLLWDP